MLLVMVERTPTWQQLFHWGYRGFLVFSILSTWWVGSWQANADPWLMTSCVLLVAIHPLFFLVPLLLYRAVRNATSLPFGLAFLALLWCGGEYLHALTDASYPWLTLGNTQTYNVPYIQFIEYTGIWGVSLVMLIQTGIIAWYTLSRKAATAVSQRSYVIAWSLLAATLVLPYIHGFIRVSAQEIADKSRSDSPGFVVTVVQPNQNPWDKWKQDDPVNHIQDNAELSFKALTEGTPTDMFLWAENAIPYPITNPLNSHRREEMYRTVDSLGVTVMTGFPDYVVHASKEEASPSSRRDSVFNPATNQVEVRYWDYYNSIGTFAPHQGITGSYHKTQLVPFGERIPFIDLAPFLIDMLSWDVGISSWAKGKSIHPIPVLWKGDTLLAGGMVCFESVYPNIVRQFVEQDAEFLTIVTNDGWYLGTPGPLQHERFAILRAIETRRWIARAANTGISCFVSPSGTISGETEEGARVTTSQTIFPRSDKTFYVRYGDWLPILCLIGAAGMGIVAVWRKRRNAGSEKSESV